MKKTISILLMLICFQLSFGQETKVGIGTFTPEAQLHVKGENAGNTKALKIDNSAGSEILNVKNDGSVELTATPSTSVGNYDILTRNKITNKIEKITSVPVPESDPVWNQARVNTKTFKGNIPGGSDLNYYLETGIYNTVSDEIASTSQNYPMAVLGSLEVFNYESATYQIYQSGGTDNSQYIRNRSTDGWADWKKVNSSSTGLERIDNEAPYSPGWRLIGRNPDNYGNIGNGSVDFSFSSSGTHGGARGDYSFATGNNHQMLLDGSNTLTTIFVSGESNIVTARPNSGLAGSSVSGYANKIGGNGYGVSAEGWMNEVESNGGATSASGYRNIGTGMASHVGGMFNYSRAQGETSLGIYGTDYTPNSNYQRIFNVGIGADYSNRKDGFTVFRDGKIKIGVEPILDNSATKLLAWKSDGTIVTASAPTQAVEKVNEGNGIGVRISGINENNYGNIGDKAVDFSTQTLSSTINGASAMYSFATGLNVTASGVGSAAFNNDTRATGLLSFASGYATQATGSYATATGNGAIASGNISHAEGQSTKATGNYSHSEGRVTTASGVDSHSQNTFTEARGNSSSASGDSNIAHSYAETALGSFGTNYTPISATVFNPLDRVLNVGIGDSNTNRKDGLTVFKDGKIKIGVEPVIDTTATKLVAWKDGILVGVDVENLKLNDVSENQEGKVNNIPLQELGGVDKMINGIRIGRGSGNGLYSVAVGEGALQDNDSGLVNSAFGNYASSKNITGSYNASFGYGSMYLNEYGSQNTAYGAYSLYNNQGLDWSSVRGHGSTAIGSQSMYSNIDGNGTAVGYHSLRSSTTAQWNIALGFQAGSAISTGSGNTIIANTGYTGYDGISSGNNNLIVAPNNGNSTGIRTGNGNVVLGYVSGLPDNAENTITLSDGVGNVALKKQTDGTTTLPNLTNELIDAEVSGQSAVTKKWVLAQLPEKKYKSYVALLTGYGEDDPTANVLENEIGQIQWERSEAGVYYATLPNAFTSNKTVAFVNTGAFDSVASAGVYNYTPDKVELMIFSRTTGEALDAMFNLSIEIRVYN